MELNKLYEMIEKIGCMTFSTANSKGEVHSRIAHFNGFDEDGLYFRTMRNKPYFRQLIASGRVTVCGMTDARVLGHDEDGATSFPPSYVIRLIGKAINVDDDIIREKAKTNDMLKTAVHDMEQYPKMRGANFVLCDFKGEIFDVDFEGVNRDHKLYRERFGFGDIEYNEAGPRINDNCVGCGACFKACSFNAIKKDGDKYKVNFNRCDDCGDCLNACKFNAIDKSLEF